MATETLEKQYAAAANVYFVLRDDAGDYFDQDDNTFKALASCIDPYFEATERILKAGASESNYVATLDLADLAPGLAVVECFAMAIRRVGGSPDLAADEVISQPEPIIAQLSQLGRRDIRARARLGVTTTAGTTMELMVWLEADGALVPLKTLDAAAECTCAVTMRGNFPQFDLDETEMGALTDGHKFEPTFDNPDFTADRVYAAEFTITSEGHSWSCVHSFGVVP